MRHWRSILGLIVVAAFAGAAAYMIAMPGASHRGPLPKLTAAEIETARRLRQDVVALSVTLGERRVGHGQSLAAAADYLLERLDGLTRAARSNVAPRRETLGADARGAENIVLQLPAARRDGLVLIGAHYDSAPGTPGANDNGTGVAVLLELTRRFLARSLERPLRFVLFANEEEPFFMERGMGSSAHAAAARARGESIRLMISLETMGYYSDKPGSQEYPWPLSLAYPSTGNFLGIVGNLASAREVREFVRSFRTHAKFPSEAAALPESIPGVGWSDHVNFWQHGYPALMLTDTAPFRYPYYHHPDDLPDHLDFDRLARVVTALEAVVLELVNPAETLRSDVN